MTPRAKELTRTLVTGAAVGGFGVAAVVGFLSSPHSSVGGVRAVAVAMLVFLLFPLVLGGSLAAAPAAVGSGKRKYFVTGKTPARVIDVVARLVGMLACGWLALMRLDDARWEVVGGLALGVAFVSTAVSAKGLFERLWGPAVPVVVLDARTLTIQSLVGTTVIAYADVRSVDVDHDNCVSLVLARDRENVQVHGPKERAAELASAILAAKDSAARRDEREQRARNELERAAGTGAGEWLRRIDALAATGHVSGAYRGGTIDEADLWTTLADDGAHTDQRAAAARILLASPDPEVRLRVVASASDIADEAVRARVRVALVPDVEEAAAEMDALEWNAPRKMG
jgi:hypothetical protein